MKAELRGKDNETELLDVLTDRLAVDIVASGDRKDDPNFDTTEASEELWNPLSYIDDLCVARENVRAQGISGERGVEVKEQGIRVIIYSCE